MPVRDAATAFRDATLVWRVTFCFQVAALIVCLVGFGTNYLVYYENWRYECHGGLWKVYFTDTYQWETDDFLRIFNKSRGWLDASKAMMSISVVAHILCIILTLGSAFFNANQLVLWGVASIEFASALSGLIGCSVAAGELKSVMDDTRFLTLGKFSVSSSFIMFLVAQFAFVGAGLLLVLDSRLRYTSRPGNPASTLKIATIF